MTDNQTESKRILEQAFQRLEDYKDACNLVGVPSQKPTAKGVEPLLADDIRSLFINAAKGGDVEYTLKQLRPRAAEAGKEEIYLYWKR